MMWARSITTGLVVMGSVAGVLSAMSVPEIPLEQVRDRINAATMQPIVRVSDIPQPVLDTLQAHIPAVPGDAKRSLLAEPGDPFNVGCVVDSNLANRRLMVGAGAAGLWFILYEHGGIAGHSHLAAIDPISHSVAALELSTKSQGAFHDAPEFIRAIRAGDFREVGVEKICRF